MGGNYFLIYTSLIGHYITALQMSVTFGKLTTPPHVVSCSRMNVSMHGAACVPVPAEFLEFSRLYFLPNSTPPAPFLLWLDHLCEQ